MSFQISSIVVLCLSTVCSCFFDLSFTIPYAEFVIGRWNLDAVAVGIGDKVVDGIAHFHGVEVGSRAEVVCAVAVLVGGLYEEDITAGVLLEIDFLDFKQGAAVAVGKVRESQMQVGILGISTLLIIAFQFDVEALLLGEVEEVEGGEVVARV